MEARLQRLSRFHTVGREALLGRCKAHALTTPYLIAYINECIQGILSRGSLRLKQRHIRHKDITDLARD